MQKVKRFISTIRRGITQVVFPNVCICCGLEALQKSHHVCTFCLEERFEYADFGNIVLSNDIILPDNVTRQFALWMFDKGGLLQNLMHNLKYERLTGIGRQLGRALARHALTKHEIKEQLSAEREKLLVPVPLHYLKYRKRGFNQAFSIARGIEEVLDIPICSIDTVQRKKITKSQTGLSLEKRIQNVRGVFVAARHEKVRGKAVIIVDDVFTTGATSFELAQTLTDAGAASIMIWTVARA